MKIVFTGGGTGGHFYPIIAVAERVNQIIDQEKIVGAKLYFASDSPYDKEALFENGLIFESVSAGKLRRYFSFLNFFDLFKTFFGFCNALLKMFSIYPDVVFSKGGYASFPTLLAARILKIPIVIHESDSAPGRVNKWAGHFARRVAVSFSEAAKYFKKDRVAWTGQPVRMQIENKAVKEEALKYFKLESNIPVLLVLGGSQGAELINDAVLDALPRLTQKFQVIHQMGVRNFKDVSERALVVMGERGNRARYVPIAFLNSLGLKMAAGAADIIISRAGSTIFEIASWGVPAILVPFAKSNADHAKKNAFSYAAAGACVVIEENNMTGNILNSEIERLFSDKELLNHMARSAKAFYHPGAASLIARQLVNIALKHEA